MGMDRLLVGRDAECAALRRGLVPKTAPGGPGLPGVPGGGTHPVILVTGEGGAGKT
jgi:hypothetical protein